MLGGIISWILHSVDNSSGTGYLNYNTSIQDYLSYILFPFVLLVPLLMFPKLLEVLILLCIPFELIVYIHWLN